MKYILIILLAILFVGCEDNPLVVIPIVITKDTSITATMVGLRPTNNQQEQWIIRNTTMRWIDSVGIFIEPDSKNIYWVRPYKELHGTLGPTWSYSIYLPLGYKVTPYWSKIPPNWSVL
jgi:hypothetical protein